METGELLVGSSFAGYRVDRLIARGGMGVVYLAVDLRLDRNVALKVLAPELSANPAFRARFEHESRLAASIDHPNVTPVYEAGERDGLLYLVTRFVEGSDLGARLERDGRLSPSTTLHILGQVARALDAAHARGLVHRDVKPGNVLLAALGADEPVEHAYLCDFGLTKRIDAPTSMTTTGEVLGTIDYVAPEQIRNESLDGRVDVYALGCLLYRCLTGRSPFLRDDDIAVIYAHLNDPPPRVTEALPNLPAALDDVVATAMAKRREDRYPTCGALIDAAREALPPEALRPGPTAPRVSKPPRPMAPHRRRRRWPIAVGLVGLLVAAGVGWALIASPGSDGEPEDVPIPLRYEVFVMDTDDTDDTGEVRLTTNGAIDDRPSWYGSLIAFSSGRADGNLDIYVMDEDGENVTRLTDNLASDDGPAWSPDGTTIAFSSDRGGDDGIYLMDAEGNDEHRVTDGQGHDGGPAWSPDGETIAFGSERTGNQDIWLIDVDGGNLRQLTEGPGDDGHPSWSPDGTKIAFSRTTRDNQHVWVIDLESGEEDRLTPPSLGGTNPAWSPNGDFILFVRQRLGQRDIWSMQSDGSGSDHRLTHHPYDDRSPAWSPDGSRVVFVRDVGPVAGG